MFTGTNSPRFLAFFLEPRFIRAKKSYYARVSGFSWKALLACIDENISLATKIEE